MRFDDRIYNDELYAYLLSTVTKQNCKPPGEFKNEDTMDKAGKFVK